MLSVIREGLEEAIEEEEMDWQMKNSPAVTNTEQLLDAGRAFANFQTFQMEWDCEFPAWISGFFNFILIFRVEKWVYIAQQEMDEVCAPSAERYN